MSRYILSYCFLLITGLFSCQYAGFAAENNTHLSQAVASAHPLATRAGLDILRKGGNAFDAAVAVTAVLAVVEPYSSGIGGGGFYLLHQAKSGEYVMIDARERAPYAAHSDLYLDSQGMVIPELSINGALAAGIPGIPAALVHLAENYGALELPELLAPAIKHAHQGFIIDEIYRRMAGFRLQALQQNPAASEIFLQQNKVPEPGYRLVQKDLADTLERIANYGHKGFYASEVASKLVAEVRENGGIWTLKDLADYKVKQRLPIVAEYRDMKVVSASLPSSGGLVLSEILGMLSLLDVDGENELQRIHYIVETMRRAYRDRAVYMGDPDFVDVPVEHLLSDGYIKSLVKGIKQDSATSSVSLQQMAQPSGNGTDTTHFSVLDRFGNKVSATLSINYPFGSCFVAQGTGVLLNDEMDDFAARAGVPNAYGLTGSSANAIAPGKRMLSSMSPTIVETDERIAIVGTPGGSRIITMVLLAILDFYNGGNAQDIVNAGRFHHQFLPDRIYFEPGVFDEELVDSLFELGHESSELDNEYGNMQMLIIDKKTGEIDAASDKRGIGEARVIH